MYTNDIKEVMISAEELAKRVGELGRQITEDFKDKKFIAVCILKGSTVFYADLARQIDLDFEFDFLSLSSYGNSRSSSGIVRFRKDLDNDIRDKHVLLIEDIMDSGQTLSYLSEILAARKPASISICTLLDKPSRRKVSITPDYRGFEIPDEFVVGYGLDYAEKYRNLPFIGILKPSAYGAE